MERTTSEIKIRSVGHRAAGVGALPAHVRTLLHHGIIRIRRRTRICAGLANLGTHLTMLIRKLPFQEHEIRTHPAGLCTLHHECDVLRIGVFSALRKAVRNAGKAFAIAGQTVLNTLFHVDAGRLRLCHFHKYLRGKIRWYIFSMINQFSPL